MTHNEKVLALLSDGQPHTHHEIYALFVIGHSRISDLRKRGHVIESWRDGDDYLYQLTTRSGETASRQAHNLETLGSTPRSATQLCAGDGSLPSPSGGPRSEADAAAGNPSPASPAQLTLEAA